MYSDKSNLLNEKPLKYISAEVRAETTINKNEQSQN